MSQNATRRLDAWTAADRAAHKAAAELLQRRLAHIKGEGPKPTDAEVGAVAQMRAESTRLYRFAMDELEEIAAQTAATFPKK